MPFGTPKHDEIAEKENRIAKVARHPARGRAGARCRPCAAGPTDTLPAALPLAGVLVPDVSLWRAAGSPPGSQEDSSARFVGRQGLDEGV